jgi:hypothetical protein
VWRNLQGRGNVVNSPYTMTSVPTTRGVIISTSSVFSSFSSWEPALEH